MEVFKVKDKIGSSWARIKSKNEDEAVAIFLRNAEHVERVEVTKEEGFGNFAKNRDMESIQDLLEKENLTGKIVDDFI